MDCLADKLPPYWWRDKELMQHELAAHDDNDAEIARVHGLRSPSLLSKWRSNHGLPLKKPGPKASPIAVVAPVRDDDDWLLVTLKQLGDDATVEEIADAADVSPKRVREAAVRLGHDGFRVEEGAGRVVMERAPRDTGRRFNADARLFDGDVFRFAVISDVHTSSKAERLDELHTAYDVIAQEGYGLVLNPGDLCDGMGIYKGQINEVVNHTYEAQVDHAVDVYPSRPGVVTQIIGGNHDLEGDFGRIGADPVQAVCNRRPDMEYLGPYSAWLDLPNGGSIHMLHPMGGASYALSYKPQKIVEGYEGGDKPSILLIGHWHRAGYFPTRGVHTLLAGTFQGPTTYSVRKAFGAPGFGFYLVECTLADDGSIVRFKPEFMPFYSGRLAQAA